VNDLCTSTQAARIEIRQHTQRQASRQTVGEVVTDWSQLLLTDDVTDSLQLMTSTQLNHILDDCKTLRRTPFVKLPTTDKSRSGSRLDIIITETDWD